VKTTLTLLLCALVAIPAVAAPPARKAAEDVCLVNLDFPGGSPMNFLVLHEVELPAPARSVPASGLFFTRALKLAPVHGSIAMANDGSVRVGLMVHSSASSTNDFTLAGVVGPTFAGEWKFDNDGDFVPNGLLPMERVDCSTITIP